MASARMAHLAAVVVVSSGVVGGSERYGKRDEETVFTLPSCEHMGGYSKQGTTAIHPLGRGIVRTARESEPVYQQTPMANFTI